MIFKKLISQMFLLLVMGCAMGGCGTTLAAKEMARLEREERFCEEHPKFGILFADALRNKRFLLGMRKEVVWLGWGYPDEINKTVSLWGVHEQWIYDKPFYETVYLYFENDVLTSWQD